MADNTEEPQKGPRIITSGTVVGAEAMQWAQRAAACLAEVIDADHGFSIDVHQDFAEFVWPLRPSDTLTNAAWRTLRLVGIPPGWSLPSNGSIPCWGCWVANTIHDCTHDPVTSEQPPPLPRPTGDSRFACGGRHE